MIEILLPIVVFVLSYLNGANDISKGIATLVGGGVTKDRTAIVWGAVTTGLGALVAVGVAGALLRTFSTGILHDQSPAIELFVAVAIGASAWIVIATRTGLPVSMTHALTGGLVGAALASLGVSGVHWSALLNKIALPLALSPVVSFGVAWFLYPLLSRGLAPANRYCVCLEVQQLQPEAIGAGALALRSSGVQIVADTAEHCNRTVGAPIRMGLADSLHWLTSGMTSFARGLNDTPKIAALLLAASAAGLGAHSHAAFGFVALAMVAGSVLSGRRVLHTMSQKITAMDAMTGFTANFGSAALIIGGTLLGMPLSTTHVTTSAIIGIGVHTNSGPRWKMVRDIAVAWIVTLPLAAAFAYGARLLLG